MGGYQVGFNLLVFVFFLLQFCRSKVTKQENNYSSLAIYQDIQQGSHLKIGNDSYSQVLCSSRAYFPQLECYFVASLNFLRSKFSSSEQ